jgi:hypothetical protein
MMCPAFVSGVAQLTVDVGVAEAEKRTPAVFVGAG